VTKGLRRILFAGAALVIVAIELFWVRLDVQEFKAHLDRELTQFTDVKLQAEQTSLTFLHGIGLKLDKVSFVHPQYGIAAGHISITIRLLPLLLGRVEVDTLDIHDALIKIRPGSMQLTSGSISTLPVERIHLIRSTIQTMDGKDVLNDLHLDLRDIGPNSVTLWEIQAHQDRQSISGHGRLGFEDGEIKGGFGKLKFEQVALARIQPFTPKAVHAFISQENGALSGALTLDIFKSSDWAVFGELELSSDDNEEPVRLRGKLRHPDQDQLNWHDSFIHLSDSAVIAIDGQCLQSQCSTRLQAGNIDLQTWSPVIPAGIKFHQKLFGSTRLNANISWDNDSWQGDIGFNLKEGRFLYTDEKEIALPELQLNTSKLSGDANSWQAEATLTSPGIKGSMKISSSQQASGLKQMFIIAEQVESRFWRPLSNVLLASLDVGPDIKATGIITGELELVQTDNTKKLGLKVDASSALLSYGTFFAKPANITALCQSEISWLGNDHSNQFKSISLHHCQLGDATLQQLNWSKKRKRQSLQISNLAVNFDQLKAQSISLSEQLNRYRGLIEGSSLSSWPVNSEQGWLQDMSGSWQLQSFGSETWDVSGSIVADRGRFNSERLLLDGAYGVAELKGQLSFADQRGHIDLLSAHLDWNKLPPPPLETGNKMVLSGSIKQANLNLLQNNWQDIEATYVWKAEKLNLKELKTSFAGGQLTSSILVLQPGQKGLAMHGKVRLRDVQLEQIQGIFPVLQAEVKGTLHANLELHGTVPNLHSAQWQQSNGDILIYSGEWKQQGKAESLTEMLGFKTPETRSHAFKKLESRFRIAEKSTTFSFIKLQQMEDFYRGSAKISADGKLAGRVEQQDEKHTSYTLSGAWPFFYWQSTQ